MFMMSTSDDQPNPEPMSKWFDASYFSEGDNARGVRWNIRYTTKGDQSICLNPYFTDAEDVVSGC
jgi:hypothetical protein